MEKPVHMNSSKLPTNVNHVTASHFSQFRTRMAVGIHRATPTNLERFTSKAAPWFKASPSEICT